MVESLDAPKPDVSHPPVEVEPTKSTKPKKLGKRSKASRAQLLAELESERTKRRRLEKKLTKLDQAPDRLIETWFQLASRNLQSQSQIASSKAQTAVLMSSVVLSMVLLTVHRTDEVDAYSALALLPLVVSSLLATAFGAMAMRPSLEPGRFSWEDVASRRARLMTVNDFHRMSITEYEQAVDAMMTNRQFLYGTIKREIHAAGVDLAQRYRQLRRAYGVFFLGASVTVALLAGPEVIPELADVQVAERRGLNGLMDER